MGEVESGRVKLRFQAFAVGAPSCIEAYYDQVFCLRGTFKVVGTKFDDSLAKKGGRSRLLRLSYPRVNYWCSWLLSILFFPLVVSRWCPLFLGRNRSLLRLHRTLSASQLTLHKVDDGAFGPAGSCLNWFSFLEPDQLRVIFHPILFYQTIILRTVYCNQFHSTGNRFQVLGSRIIVWLQLLAVRTPLCVEYYEGDRVVRQFTGKVLLVPLNDVLREETCALLPSEFLLLFNPVTNGDFFTGFSFRAALSFVETENCGV